MAKSKLPKPKIKYNKGKGAILCNKCNVVIKENLTKDEFNGKTDAIYCNVCAKQEIEKFINEKYH